MSLDGALAPTGALAAQKDSIVQEWLARALQSYPEHTGRFLARERDPFRNPVGHTLKMALPALFDQLVGDTDAAAVSSILDDILRIRAVQDFSAGQAVAFLFLLKPVIRDALQSSPHPPLSPGHPALERGRGEDTQGVRGEGAGWLDALAALEAKIDQMVLLAFDRFMRCREAIYEIKANEARRRIGVLFRRYGANGRNGETESRGSGDASIAGSPIGEWTEP